MSIAHFTAPGKEFVHLWKTQCMSDTNKSTDAQSENVHCGNWPTRIAIVSVIIAVTLIGLYILPFFAVCGCTVIPTNTAELQYENNTDTATGDRTDTVRVETMDTDYVLIVIKQDRGYVYEGSYRMVTTQVNGSSAPRFAAHFDSTFADGTGFLLDSEGQYVKIRGVEENNTIVAYSVKDGIATIVTPRGGRQIP